MTLMASRKSSTLTCALSPASTGFWNDLLATLDVSRFTSLYEALILSIHVHILLPSFKFPPAKLQIKLETSKFF
jgi:hypothetical protein